MKTALPKTIGIPTQITISVELLAPQTDPSGSNDSNTEDGVAENDGDYAWSRNRLIDCICPK